MPPLFDGTEVLHSAFHKAKLFSGNYQELKY